MRNYYNSEEILFDKCKSFTINKHKDYKEQIEQKLQSLSELYQSKLPLRCYRYKVTAEYNDVVIVLMSDNGDIIVNS